MKNNYVLIDCENVMPDQADLLDQDWIRVILFVGKTQKKLPVPLIKAIQKLGGRAEYVEISGSGPNALDFHIAYYIGRISATDKDAYFHVVSKDSGYDPLITHIQQEHHALVDRVTKIEDIKALVQAKAVSKSPADRIAFAADRLLKPNATRPRKRKTLASHVAAMFQKVLAEEDVAGVVEGLFRNGVVRENGDRIVYSDETSRN